MSSNGLSYCVFWIFSLWDDILWWNGGRYNILDIVWFLIDIPSSDGPLKGICHKLDIYISLAIDPWRLLVSVRYIGLLYDYEAGRAPCTMHIDTRPMIEVNYCFWDQNCA